MEDVMMKKLLLMSLSLAIFLSTTSISFAEGNSREEFVEAKAVYVGVERHPSDLNSAPAPKGALPAKPQHKSGYKSDAVVKQNASLQATASSWNYLSGYIIYNQISSYNCGPATVQAALTYLVGDWNTPDQSTIAQGCNTTTNGSYINDMVAYINRQQKKYKYTGRFNENLAGMRNALYSGVSNSNVAPIIGLTFSTSDGWPYSTNGHFVSVYGAKSDKSSFALADPWIGFSGSGLSGQSSSYSKSASALYKAYNRVNIGLMY
jgi:predicted double-glycine peptidase